jgi:hypothetical protein
MLGTSRGGMTQSKKGFGNVAWHGDVNVAGSIIPGNGEPKVAGPGPVLGDCIPGGKSIKEVISIRLGEEFDTKIVDGKGKSCALISVAPETRGLGNWKVSIRGKVLLELIVLKDGSLFEAIHAFADHKVDKTFGVKVLDGEIILVDDFLEIIAAVDAHVLVNEHVGQKGKILQVTSAVTGTKMGIGNDTIEMEFGVYDTNSRRTDILIRIKTITTNRHEDSEDLGFARLHYADKVGESYLVASRDLIRENEDNCVVAKNGIVDQARFVETLSALSPLIQQ